MTRCIVAFRVVGSHNAQGVSLSIFDMVQARRCLLEIGRPMDLGWLPDVFSSGPGAAPLFSRASEVMLLRGENATWSPAMC